MFGLEAYNGLVDTADRREGVLAFDEKRKPVFKGRKGIVSAIPRR